FKKRRTWTNGFQEQASVGIASNRRRHSVRSAVQFGQNRRITHHASRFTFHVLRFTHHDMDFDLVIKNGTIVTAESTYRADVGVRGERIAAIGETLSGTREIDASGKLVTPGAVDIHVHMQMPLPSGVVSA